MLPVIATNDSTLLGSTLLLQPQGVFVWHQELLYCFDNDLENNGWNLEDKMLKITGNSE